MTFQESAPLGHGSVPRELLQTFNSALIASYREEEAAVSGELDRLMGSREMGAILSAVKDLSKTSGVSESEASIAMIRTFRKLDAAWSALLVQEGIEKLRSSGVALES